MSNDSKMRLAPPELKISDADGFAKSDIFGYAEFGARLANTICSWQPPLVFALTSQWGAGKSVFAKQLAGELCKKWAQAEKGREAQDAPVIYFDAFANDYQKNALFALAGEVMEFIGRREKMAGKASESIARIGKGVGKTLAECAARYVTMGAAGVGDVSEAMKTALDKRMEDAKEGREVVKEFRNALENAAKELGGGQPLVFIVDELDRCRPDFALELLEKIKHLFSVPNVCFLVVTNLEQFKAVVQRTYGYDDDKARMYLDKFFHHVFQLPKVQKSKERLYVEHLLKSGVFPFHDSNHVVRDMLTELAIVHHLELRDIERILTVIALVSASVKKDDLFKTFPIVFIVGLCVMRRVNPELFENAATGAPLFDSDAYKFMQFSQWSIRPDTYETLWNKLGGPLPHSNQQLQKDFRRLPQLIEELDDAHYF